MLKEALESLARQTMVPSEVLVGDDDPEASGRAVVEAFAGDSGLPARYYSNNPSLGQAGNVGALIDQVCGEKVCLLHDDDWLMPESLADLNRCFEENPSIVAAYGQQLIASDDGVIDAAASENLNATYHRTSAKEGLQSDAIRAAVLQQFPNDGWLVNAEAAKAVDYAGLGTEFRDAVDFVFGVELAKLKVGAFYFLNKPTAVYRLSESSIIRNRVNSTAYHAYCYVAAQADVDIAHPDIAVWLQHRSCGAIVQALDMGKRREAWQIYWSKAHCGRILSAGGAKRFLRMLTPL